MVVNKKRTNKRTHKKNNKRSNKRINKRSKKILKRSKNIYRKKKIVSHKSKKKYRKYNKKTLKRKYKKQYGGEMRSVNVSDIELYEDNSRTLMGEINVSQFHDVWKIQIEGEGKYLFSKIEGDKDTIMGLPIKQIKEYLKKIK